MFLNVKEIEAAELARWMEAPPQPFRIIDVREMGEIAAGTIPGAEPMPLATVPLHMQHLPRDATMVVVCRSGARSAQACAYLQQQGYEKVFNLRGGMFAWAGAGQPIGLPNKSVVGVSGNR
ncbi:MAG: rhodanese-like domain-containing protein [Gammaproteobacteria bacterium]|nr:rhodanese-like domain-containing protein [Gammaproteobacteria bacterium]